MATQQVSKKRVPSSKDGAWLGADSNSVWGVCGFLLLAIAVIYGQTLGYAFLEYDDSTFVYGDPHVAAGLTGAGFRWALTDGPGGEWYPLAMLSHMLDCQLFGLNAWGHHLTNVLLHAASSIALFYVLWRMTGEFWPSVFVAAVFAVHPQHVESVAWVAERKDVLSGLFFVLTLGAYLGYVRGGRPLTWYLLLTVFFTLGLLAKPMVVTLPALLLLLDFWPLARFGAASDTPGWTKLIERPGVLFLGLEKLPLFALAAGDCLVTVRTHASGGVLLPLPVRLGNGVVSCVTYALQFFCPVDLAAFYPSPSGGPPAWKVAGALAIVAAVSTAAVIWRRRCPYFFVGWFWYLGVLFPVLGLFTVAWFSMADRFMYLPSIGLAMALAWGAARLVGGSPAGRWNLGVYAALAIAVLVACATWQTSIWRDDETLWRHTLSCTADNSKAEVGLADALARRDQLDEAMPYYRRAMEHPLDYVPFNQLGILLGKQGKTNEAIKLFRRSVEIQPDAFDAHLNLGLALAVTNQFNESAEHFRRALEIDPLRVNAHCGLAFLLRREGKVSEARAEFERAIELDPRNTAAHNDLALMLLAQGEAGAARTHFESVLALDPNNRTALAGLNKLQHRGDRKVAP